MSARIWRIDLVCRNRAPREVADTVGSAMFQLLESGVDATTAAVRISASHFGLIVQAEGTQVEANPMPTLEPELRRPS